MTARGARGTLMGAAARAAREWREPRTLCCTESSARRARRRARRRSQPARRPKEEHDVHEGSKAHEERRDEPRRRRGAAKRSSGDGHRKLQSTPAPLPVTRTVQERRRSWREVEAGGGLGTNPACHEGACERTAREPATAWSCSNFAGHRATVLLPTPGGETRYETRETTQNPRRSRNRLEIIL